jgi:hypothetical protein
MISLIIHTMCLHAMPADFLEAVCRMSDLHSCPVGPKLKKLLKPKDFIAVFENLDSSPDASMYSVLL